jgi:hypothetical protein
MTTTLVYAISQQSRGWKVKVGVQLLAVLMTYDTEQCLMAKRYQPNAATPLHDPCKPAQTTQRQIRDRKVVEGTLRDCLARSLDVVDKCCRHAGLVWQ